MRRIGAEEDTTMNNAITQRVYEASGEGRSRAPTGNGFLFFRVWREKGTGLWFQAHPTNPRGDDVRFDGDVADVVEWDEVSS